MSLSHRNNSTSELEYSNAKICSCKPPYPGVNGVKFCKLRSQSCIFGNRSTHARPLLQVAGGRFFWNETNLANASPPTRLSLDIEGGRISIFPNAFGSGVSFRDLFTTFIRGPTGRNIPRLCSKY